MNRQSIITFVITAACIALVYTGAGWWNIWGGPTNVSYIHYLEIVVGSLIIGARIGYLWARAWGDR